MKNIFKGFIALFVIAIATIIIVPNVLANIASTDKGTITVSGIDDTDHKTVTVTAYRLMDVDFDYDTQQPKEPVYKWVAGVQQWVRANFSDYIGTDGRVTEKFNSSLSAKKRAEFYDKLAAAIKGGTVSVSEAGHRTGNGNIDGLDMGNYLVLIENGIKVYRPSAVNVVPELVTETVDGETTKSWKMTSPAEIELKKSDPQIDKKVQAKDSTGNATDELQTYIGKELVYSIVVDIPKYPDNATYKNLKLSVTLSDGLTFGKDVKVYDVSSVASPKVADVATYTPITSELASYYTESNNGFVYNFTNTDYTKVFITPATETEESTLKYSKIFIVYSATVNKDAVVSTDGNPNNAKLEYNNNPYKDDVFKVEPDVVKVFTYGIKIHKFRKDTSTSPVTYPTLGGATFQITDVTGNTAGTANTVLEFVMEEEGVYHLAVEGEEGVTSKIVGKASDGTVIVKGLAEGTYQVEETKAPDGYQKVQTKYSITITDTRTCEDKTNGCGEDYTEGDLRGIVSDPTPARLVPNADPYTPVDGLVDQDIINNAFFELPVTGGVGTLIFSVLGIVFMGIAISLVRSIFKNKNVENI